MSSFMSISTWRKLSRRKRFWFSIAVVAMSCVVLYTLSAEPAGAAVLNENGKGKQPGAGINTRKSITAKFIAEQQNWGEEEPEQADAHVQPKRERDVVDDLEEYTTDSYQHLAAQIRALSSVGVPDLLAQLQSPMELPNSAFDRLQAVVDAYVRRSRAGIAVDRAVARMQDAADALEAADASRRARIAGAANVSNDGSPVASPPPRPRTVRHEEDIMTPEPTTYRCHMGPDAFEMCEYENICVDMPYLTEGGMVESNQVLFVGSELLPDKLDAADTKAHDAGPESRIHRHLDRLHPYPDIYFPQSVQEFEKVPHDFHVVWEDVDDEHVALRHRTYPFGFRGRPKMISARDTVSIGHGGTFEGHVTWLDNMYVAHDILDHHLWGWSITVTFPLLGAHILNHSEHLHLPPLENLLIMNCDVARYMHRQSYMTNKWRTDDWATHFLDSVLEYITGERPFVGKFAYENGSWLDIPYQTPAASGPDFAFPAWESLAHAFRDGLTLDQFTRMLEGRPVDAARQDLKGFLRASDVPQMPYGFQIMKNRRKGTRIMYNVGDVPVPPVGLRDGDFDKMRHTRKRVCARRAVLLGERPLFVGGAAEANAVREFAHRQLGIGAAAAAATLPPARALVFDRGRDKNGEIKGRGFYNLDAMLDVLRKYDVPFDVMFDANITRMSFAEQARMVSSYGLVVIAHGAGETNLAFLPRRSAVIEVSPYGMWCPLYTRMLTNMGHHVFAVISHLKAPRLTYTYMDGERAPDWLNKSMELSKTCDGKTMPDGAYGFCWHEAKQGAVFTPIHEFERAVLDAMSLLGIKVFPKIAAIDMIHGVPQNGDYLRVYDPGYYKKHASPICAPTETCAPCDRPAMP